MPHSPTRKRKQDSLRSEAVRRSKGSPHADPVTGGTVAPPSASERTARHKFDATAARRGRQRILKHRQRRRARASTPGPVYS